jgi:uncharacterized GH25 family protein
MSTYTPIRRHSLAAVAALVLSSATVAAHDLWIEPTSFTPAAGALVGVRLRVGDNLQGDPVPRDPTRIAEFVVLDASSRSAIPGRDGGDPAGLLRVTRPGLTVIGYRSHPSPLTLSGPKFTAYLKEEGLESVIALRAARRQTGQPARELFSRCAKALIVSGVPSPDAADARVGCPLELMLERNPYALGASRNVPVQLIYEGRPLAGALVVAFTRDAAAAKFTARTGADGRVSIPVDRPGLWLIKAVHMTPATSGSGADWQSFWASTTFAYLI